jgi:hypothetical protein
MSNLYRALLASLTVAICGGVYWAAIAAERVQPTNTAGPRGFTQLDASRVEGHFKCVDCHKQEVKAWLQSKHATRAFDMLRTAETAQEYAEKLDIRPADIATKSMCVHCHATPTRTSTGLHDVINGVSCESCHNASGGDDGWLNSHAVYGPIGTRRGQESAAHYARRRESSSKAGQLRSSDLYGLVKRCYQCHVVGDETLAEAGHDHGEGFEFVAKASGEVRHNFFLEPSLNAAVATLWTDPMHHGAGRQAAGRKRVMFVVGQLVDLEVSLRNLATASEENDFTDMMQDRIEDALETLAEDLLEELEDTELPLVREATDAVTPVFESLDDDGFQPEEKESYIQAADRVGSAARRFAERDGNGLTEIDDLDLLPEGPFDGVFQP